MSGLIALVGGDEFRRNCEPMDRALLARLGDRPKVVIIPTAAARESPGLAAENGVRYFDSLGAQAEAAMIIDAGTARQPALAARVKNADLIYFTGGDPVYLLETMRNSPAWMAAKEALQRNRILAGSSAGAMILGGQMWAPGEGWRKGLGLVPHIAVIPHHASLASRWNADHLRASLAEGVILVGIDEATALVGPPWQVLGAGQVTVYRGKELAIFQDGQSVPLPDQEPGR
jgi:cyanophycinase